MAEAVEVLSLFWPVRIKFSPLADSFRKPPVTAFRRWVNGLGSMFGVGGRIVPSFVCVFRTFDSGLLLGLAGVPRFKMRFSDSSQRYYCNRMIYS